jgi:hypothetical protein
VRVEFQSRGSPHAHCLIWLDSVPEWRSEAGIKFFESNDSCSLDTAHKDIVTRNQRHSHTDTCNKYKSGNGRFSFPHSVCDSTVVYDDEDIIRHKGRCFSLKRTADEAMINCYHPLLLPIIKCNMDIQPVVSGMAISYYIVKYMSKSEPSQAK